MFVSSITLKLTDTVNMTVVLLPPPNNTTKKMRFGSYHTTLNENALYGQCTQQIKSCKFIIINLALLMLDKK